MRRIAKITFLSAVFLGAFSAWTYAEELSIKPLPEGYSPNEREQSLSLDIYRQNVHQEITHFIRDSENVRHLKRGSMPTLDVNAFDEVPDSLFFTNRQGKNKMSGEELKRGPRKSETARRGPAPGTWKVLKGKNTGMNRGMFIEDSEGVKFLLKFDPEENIELASGAESVTSRIFHAIGYNVPEYYVTTFTREQLVPAANARYYAESGFNKPLTQDGVDEILSRLPKAGNGGYRASASKVLEGHVLGRDEFDGRRKKDPNDPVWHRDRRTFRALRVFGSWINYYDLIPQNSLEVVLDMNGKHVIKHYIIDFGSTLGSAGYEVKPDVFGFEHLFDYGEIFKSLITLGFYNKPWQRRTDRPIDLPPASVGNFDNREFDPGKWKAQLPVYAYKELTPADAFWAAKIIKQFSDEDIRTLVEVGEYSDGRAVDYLSKTLAERRDIIARYWFKKVSPLTDFELNQQGGALSITFTDLSETYGFVNGQDTSYRFEVFDVKPNGDKGKSLGSGTAGEASVTLNEGKWSSSGKNIVEIYAKHGTDGPWLPPVILEINKGQPVSLKHQ